ncbi:MAG: phenylacetate-CoA oxygenase subunit PaaJ [Alcanivoracaceae bacterium]|nr:phenylacetate-CoA oxygenase subunit PaaJ [Alcanivoracaceae bacterium]
MQIVNGSNQQILKVLKGVTDPEIPVLSLQDLGVIRNVSSSDMTIEVTITPTYSGCPAMELMEQSIVELLSGEFSKEIIVITKLSPAWTTDWMTEHGKKVLFEYGIMPPTKTGKIICPQCQSQQVELISQFGSTACKALYRCTDCLEPFDYFKCH